MKKIFVLLSAICVPMLFFSSYGQDCPLLYTTPPSTTAPGSLEDVWEKRMLLQMKKVEKKFGVLFEKEWTPHVVFVNHQYYAAQYSQQTHTFTITRWYQTLLLPHDDTEKPETFLIHKLMRHELGHALAEQTSYRSRCRPWPDTVVWKHGTKRQRLVQAMISEGLGEYFGNLLQEEDTATDSSWIPKKRKYCIWKPSDWIYSGGYWLVKPILDRFGVYGLQYILDHTIFPGKRYNLRKRAVEYQGRALQILTAQYGPSPQK